MRKFPESGKQLLLEGASSLEFQSREQGLILPFMNRTDLDHSLDSAEIPRDTSSRAEALHPCAGALQATEKFLGPGRKWNIPGSPVFQNVLPHLVQELPYIDAQTLLSVASRGNVEEVNQFLESKGSQMRCNPVGPDEIVAASVLDLRVRWLQEGERTELSLEQGVGTTAAPRRVMRGGMRDGGMRDGAMRDGGNDVVPAFKLKTGIQFHDVPGHNHLIVELQTQPNEVGESSTTQGNFQALSSGLEGLLANTGDKNLSDIREELQRFAKQEGGTRDRVFITRWDNGFPSDPLALTALVTHLSRGKSLNPMPKDKHGYGVSGVICPMVDFYEEKDITWLLGASTQGDDGLPAIVQEAKQANSLQMNHLGAVAKSDVVVRVARSADNPLKIDGPFLIWFERETPDGKFQAPFFSAGISREHMKDPGNLKF